MKIVIDANVLFSALIKDSGTRKLWFNSTLELYAPSFLLLELEKYEKLLFTKSKTTKVDFERVKAHLLSQVNFIKDSELASFIPAAKTLTTDLADVLYLAHALKIDACIWTNDEEFQKQTRVKIKTTIELAKEILK